MHRGLELIELKCPACGQEFVRERAKVEQNARRGLRCVCSVPCASKLHPNYIRAKEQRERTRGPRELAEPAQVGSHVRERLSGRVAVVTRVSPKRRWVHVQWVPRRRDPVRRRAEDFELWTEERYQEQCGAE